MTLCLAFNSLRKILTFLHMKCNNTTETASSDGVLEHLMKDWGGLIDRILASLKKIPAPEISTELSPGGGTDPGAPPPTTKGNNLS